MREEFVFRVSKDTDAAFGESFWIPQYCNALYIDLEIEMEYGVMGYIVVWDEKNRIRLQKLIGHGQRHLAVGGGSMCTSLGGIPGDIGEGNWRLVICIFTEYVEQMLGDGTFEFCVRLSDEDHGQELKELVGEKCWIGGDSDIPLYHDGYDWKREYQSQSRWYKGDFHTHTRLSDGKETVENAMKKAVYMGMDYYVPTEHNAIHTGWIDTDVMVVPGIEITTEDGHCNLFGIDRMPKYLPKILADMGGERTQEYVLRTVEEARERGWIVSINHPFLHIWQWRHKNLKLREVDCIEIVNDPTYEYAKEANRKAIRLLDWLWQDGYRIWGVGGSDSHNLIDERYPGATEPSIAGDPGTYVHMDGMSPEKLLGEVKRGHVYVSRYCTLDIWIEAEGGKTYLPGDEIFCDGKTEVAYRFRIHGLGSVPVVYKVESRVRSRVEVVCEEISNVKTGSEVVYAGETKVIMGDDNWQWMRLEIRDESGDFLAYVNPIYYGQKSHKFFTYGQAVQGLEEEEGERND